MISEFPLLVFTVLTGVAAGGYAMATLFGIMTKKANRSWLFSLACMVCLGLGLLGVLFHLGHPERFLNALANPTAMIAQEAYWSIPFGIVLLADTILLKLGKGQGQVLPIVGSLLACGLMAVTSIAYFTSYGVVGWAELPTIFLFVVGDLGLGAALALAAFPAARQKVPALLAVVLYCALFVTVAAEVVVFGGYELNAVPFMIAAVPSLVAAALQCVGIFRSGNDGVIAWVVFALVAAAVIVARYGFYAVA